MAQKKITALIFDMDGLIFDSERVVQRSWNRAGEVLGIPKMGEHIYHTSLSKIHDTVLRTQKTSKSL